LIDDDDANESESQKQQQQQQTAITPITTQNSSTTDPFDIL
jgi:hypothetical protein